MKLVDANVLLYAVNSDSDRHEVSKSWLDGALNGTEVVGFAWLALLAFVRLATMPSMFPHPLAVPAACGRVRDWLDQSTSVVVQPSPRHVEILEDLLAAIGGVGGNLVNDAHLAALAIEHRATIVTFDNDFGRFPGVVWTTPSHA